MVGEFHGGSQVGSREGRPRGWRTPHRTYHLIHDGCQNSTPTDPPFPAGGVGRVRLGRRAGLAGGRLVRPRPHRQPRSRAGSSPSSSEADGERRRHEWRFDGMNDALANYDRLATILTPDWPPGHSAATGPSAPAPVGDDHPGGQADRHHPHPAHRHPGRRHRHPRIDIDTWNDIGRRSITIPSGPASPPAVRRGRLLRRPRLPARQPHLHYRQRRRHPLRALSACASPSSRQPPTGIGATSWSPTTPPPRSPHAPVTESHQAGDEPVGHPGRPMAGTARPRRRNDQDFCTIKASDLVEGSPSTAGRSPTPNSSKPPAPRTAAVTAARSVGPTAATDCRPPQHSGRQPLAVGRGSAVDEDRPTLAPPDPAPSVPTTYPAPSPTPCACRVAADLHRRQPPAPQRTSHPNILPDAVGDIGTVGRMIAAHVTGPGPAASSSIEDDPLMSGFLRSPHQQAMDIAEDLALAGREWWNHPDRFLDDPRDLAWLPSSTSPATRRPSSRRSTN